MKQKITKTDAETLYTPKKFKMNIYFNSSLEANKVANYLNKNQNGRYYTIFSTSLEKLEHVKSMCEKDGRIKKTSPLTYHRLTGYRLYETAEDYFAILSETENSLTQNSSNEEDLFIK